MLLYCQKATERLPNWSTLLGWTNIEYKETIALPMDSYLIHHVKTPLIQDALQVQRQDRNHKLFHLRPPTEVFKGLYFLFFLDFSCCLHLLHKYVSLISLQHTISIYQQVCESNILFFLSSCLTIDIYYIDATLCMHAGVKYRYLWDCYIVIRIAWLREKKYFPFMLENIHFSREGEDTWSLLKRMLVISL